MPEFNEKDKQALINEMEREAEKRVARRASGGKDRMLERNPSLILILQRTERKAARVRAEKLWEKRKDPKVAKEISRAIAAWNLIKRFTMAHAIQTGQIKASKGLLKKSKKTQKPNTRKSNRTRPR